MGVGVAPRWPPLDPESEAPFVAFPSTVMYQRIAGRLKRWGYPIKQRDEGRPGGAFIAATYYAAPWLVAMYTRAPVDPELRDAAARQFLRDERARSVLVAAWRLGGADAVRDMLAPGSDPWW